MKLFDIRINNSYFASWSHKTAAAHHRNSLSRVNDDRRMNIDELMYLNCHQYALYSHYIQKSIHYIYYIESF